MMKLSDLNWHHALLVLAAACTTLAVNFDGMLGKILGVVGTILAALMRPSQVSAVMQSVAVAIGDKNKPPEPPGN